MVQWRIYYTDGSMFDSTMGAPEDAPGWGVAAISQQNPETGRAGVAGVDFYWWESDVGFWSGGDMIGFVEQFAAFPRFRGSLKVGRTIARHADWRALKERIITDPDFPSLSKPFRQAYVAPAKARGVWST